MEDHLGRPRFHAPLTRLAIVLLLLTAGAARAESPAASARAGLELATSAARAWAMDAQLVYIENDEALDASGRSSRWGYLFRSESRGRARAWSVSDGRIITAENLDLRFEAPTVLPGWLDSDAVMAAAEKGAEQAARREPRGRLQTMLLMRGAESEQQRDATTWTFVYGLPGGASLHVVVDASTGRLQRTWRS